MTTIASDGRTVAADGLILVGDEPIGFDYEKLVERDGRVFGFSGSARFQMPVIQWVLSGADPEHHPKQAEKDDEWIVAEFRHNGVVTHNSSSPYPFIYPYPFTTGSGQDYAIMALACGKTPEEAVRMAMRFNVRTGGEVMVLDVPKQTAEIEALPMAAE